jgi:hypothetical protein
MFFRNINAIIDNYSANRFTAGLRKTIMGVYFAAVDTVGSKIFANLKGLT